MRILTIIVGALLTILGVFSVANAGLSFLSLAFPIGVVLIIVGMVECFAYKRTVEDEENRHWVLIEGLTTFYTRCRCSDRAAGSRYRCTCSFRYVEYDFGHQRICHRYSSRRKRKRKI